MVGFDYSQFSGIIDVGLVDFFVRYKYFAIIFFSLLFKESGPLMASFLSANGFWSMETVFLCVFLGSSIADFFWYFVGLKITRNTKKWKFYNNNYYSKFSGFVDKMTRRRPFLILVFMKFIYGTRFLMAIYVGIKKVSVGKFFIWNSIGTVIWLLVILPIGWFAGKGASEIINIYKYFEYTVLGLVVFLVLFNIISRFISKKLLPDKQDR